MRSTKNRTAIKKKMKSIRRVQSKVKDLKMIEETLKSEKEKIKNLKKYVECPVCLDIPRKGLIFSCPNGHIICQKCKVGQCPVCRVRVGNNKSILALAFIENILHNCKFDGCEEEYPLEKIENHEKYCFLRVVSCPHGQCVKKVQLNDILVHFYETGCSGNSVPRAFEGSSVARSFNFKDDLDRKMANPEYACSWPLKMFSYQDSEGDGHYFVLCASKSGDYYHITMVMFESPLVCSDINIEIEVFEHSASPDKQPYAKLRCNPCSIDEAKSDMKHLGLSVHYKVMEKMVLKEESFVFTVRITFV